MRATISDIASGPSPSAARIWSSRSWRCAMYSRIFSLAVSDQRPVRGIDDPWFLREQSFERVQVLAQVAPLAGNHRRSDAEDIVARKEGSLFFEYEAEMIFGMPRRVDGAQRRTFGAQYRSLSDGCNCQPVAIVEIRPRVASRSSSRRSVR